MRLRIVTWNINSVRLRLGLVQRLVRDLDPDVLCLQEIKCTDELFPREAFTALGFSHQEVRGQSGYHGVATLSKRPISALPQQSFCGTPEARHLGVALEAAPQGQRIALHNLYIPAGGDIPDPGLNPKFKQKLAYLKTLADWCGAERGREGLPAIMLGDFNVAPLETDVWSHKQLLKVVSHTPVEVDHLGAVKKAGGWTDLVRAFIPAEQKLYSWWSYRARDWAASDRGRRLDHVWSTPDLAGHAMAARVLKDARGWDQPSDHVPVIVDLDIAQ